MKKKQYDMSIIIPVYNTEKYVEKTLKSVLKQKYDFSKLQLVIINDCSSDNSEKILQPYLSKYENIVYRKNEENMGLAKTRNLALTLCDGKYIMFLDSDDTISEDTVGSIVEFFDEHYDEIDLVSYRLIPIMNGKELKEHYRSYFLTKTGVYDLTKKEAWFASITTMNYCIKNKFEKNIVFDTTPDFFHEDQKFSMDIIKDKMKIGYVDKGVYWYLQQPQSITKTKFHAYYLFNTTMTFWETFFEDYKNNIPEYYQALFINDINWKNRAGIFMPYQYEGEELENQLSRVKNILNKINDDVILLHPGVDLYHRYYWLDFKYGNSSKNKVTTRKDGVIVTNENKLIFADSKIDINLLEFRIVNDELKMLICIKSPAFLYEKSMPKLFVSYDMENVKTEEFPVRESSYSYFGCKEKCAKFYLSEIKINYKEENMFKFLIEFKDSIIGTRFVFPVGTVFWDFINRYNYLYDNKYLFSYIKKDELINIEKATKNQIKEYNKDRNNYFWYNDKKKWLVRFIAKFYKTNKPIWLYYDCKGVKKDNGYYQFMHDIDKKDGIKRYYVSNNSKEFNKGLFTGKTKRRVIKFKSLKHKFIYLRANKVITAYVEQENASPYMKKAYNYYIDIAKIPEVIYLQHGILHAHMPWKYSLDRLPLNREVISTYYEKENMVKNYCFTDEHLIDCGMPRYDFLDQDVKPTNTILYAPSWRSYLVGKQTSEYAKLEDNFKESEFYIETQKFLNSKELRDMLEKYDYTLNFKLHPIFKKYEYLYKSDNDRIKIGADLPDSEYKIFMTDFSSYVFDFIYLKRAIIYFVPDYVKFKSGMNLYRELDFKFENGIGDFTQDAQSTLTALEEILKNNGEASKDKKEKMNKFFIHNDYSQRDRLYEELMKDC